ncbi:hypothetical protein DW196_07845 [Vagococcus sp. AM17-17]|nr:hypothetical protein DW196_07845 [Vagococcus sp. AM17-17]
MPQIIHVRVVQKQESDYKYKQNAL